MTIFEGSRYAEAAVLRVKGADGKSRPTVYAMIAPVAQEQPYRLYPVVAGERMDTIATSLWDDPELWWQIANLNPQILYPDSIPPGTVLRVPVL
jgi:nucleoid-associated protein YgaU